MLDQACQKILEFDYGNKEIGEALRNYAQTTLPRVLPIFPTLIRLSCEAVGGKPEKTKNVATAMTLITASGDIHDDIIDNSTHKFQKKTIFGRYGKEIALLAGDTLLIQGIALLNKCDDLSVEQKSNIIDLIAKSMFEMVKAEAFETMLRKKNKVTVGEYFETIKLKGSVAELQCRIGGIIGCADVEDLDNLAHYGRVVGILSTMKEEFVDLQNISELRHRIESELAPYPVIFALQDKTLDEQIGWLLLKKDLSRKDLQFIANKVIKSEMAQKLKYELSALGQKELEENRLLKEDTCKEAAIILKVLAAEM